MKNLNLLFKGDNLEVLKALLPTHLNQVKCVYLDPPYNTGVSRKHFRDDRSSHEWVEMMRKRLKVLKQLLRDDGSIWISIDDSELGNLRKLCDEVFGNENFLATIVWQHKINWDGYKGKFQLDHTYIVAYRKTEKFKFEKNVKPRTVWLESDVGGQADAIKESKSLFGENNTFSTPKPEGLMRYLIEITTKKGDIVLDGFSGSGTTGSAAHKLGRRWIMMEINDQCESHILPRMKKIAQLQSSELKKSKKVPSSYFAYFSNIKDYKALIK